MDTVYVYSIHFVLCIFAFHVVMCIMLFFFFVFFFSSRLHCALSTTSYYWVWVFGDHLHDLFTVASHKESV